MVGTSPLYYTARVSRVDWSASHRHRHPTAPKSNKVFSHLAATSHRVLYAATKGGQHSENNRQKVKEKKITHRPTSSHNRVVWHVNLNFIYVGQMIHVGIFLDYSSPSCHDQFKWLRKVSCAMLAFASLAYFYGSIKKIC